MNDSGLISSVIVTYNPDIEVLNLAVESVLPQVDYVIIIDNKSDKNFDNKFRDNNKVKLIKLHDNLGLAKAQNIGIREAESVGSEYIILFDQDSIVTENFVGTLLKENQQLLSQGVNVGAIGPMFYDRESCFKYAPTIYKGPFIKKVPYKNEPVEVTFIIASGSLIKLSVLKSVGLMREEFFIDFVDVEWSLRAKKLGYSIFMSPLAIMEHNIGDERVKIFGRLISMHSDFRKFYIFRNGLYMMKLKYVPFWYKVRVLVFNFIRSLLGVVLSNKPISSLKSISRGWFKGVITSPDKKEIIIK